MAKLIFFDKDHQYQVDGVIVPSVTQVLSILATNEISPAILQAAADRGTRVHETCTAYDYEGDDVEVDGDIVSYIEAYASFKRDYQIGDWILCEQPMHVLDVLAGTPDRYGIIDGKRTIVDIKTTSKPNPMLHTAQLCGYEFLMTSNGFEVDALADLYLKKNGRYTLRYPTPLEKISAQSILMHCQSIEKLRRNFE